MSETVQSEWPPRPDRWPEVMTDIEVCQYLRLDQQHQCPASAKRSLRYIRRTRGLPSIGRLGSKILFRKAAVDLWLAANETGGSNVNPNHKETMI